MKRQFFTVGVLFCAVFLTASVALAQQPKLLFSFSEAPQTVTAKDSNSPASIREVKIDFNIDSNLIARETKIAIPLFDGETITATRRNAEGLVSRGEHVTWRGRNDIGGVASDVVITFGRNAVNGLIYSKNKVYEITTIRGEQMLMELDQSKFPDCDGPVKPPAEDTKPVTSTNVGASSDSGNTIDVLVVYTEAVKNAVGGDAQAQNLAQSAIDITNTAYLNSKITQRLRLVHSEETALTEANSLSNLRADSATQQLRNQQNADMVAMLVNSLGGCGIGYVMTTVSSGFAPSSYSITRRSCAVGNLTFAHELGHNMGSTHDPANGGSAAYAFSYGHYVNGSYRSVMSYSNQCTSGCTRVPQFSSPSVVFNEAATGILGERNNARSLRNTADTVANFRYSGSSITLSNYTDGGGIPHGIAKSLRWTSNNVAGNVKIEFSRDAGTTWSTLIGNTANDGSEDIRLYGPPTRQARIRVTSLTDPDVSDTSVKTLSLN